MKAKLVYCVDCTAMRSIAVPECFCGQRVTVETPPPLEDEGRQG